jgi:hypothetical protein
MKGAGNAAAPLGPHAHVKRFFPEFGAAGAVKDAIGELCGAAREGGTDRRQRRIRPVLLGDA